MKKIISILVIVGLVLSGIGAVGLQIEKTDSNISDSHPELVIEVKGRLCNNLIIKNIGDADATDDDDEPPVTNICFDSTTGMVTLFAMDYPLNQPWSGIKATYYRIDSPGDFSIYTAPFKLPEGTHTVYYYSKDIQGNTESLKSATFTFDSTPPTVKITSPEGDTIYLFGTPFMSRFLGTEALCIGIVPVTVTADDHGGSGVNKVFFSYNNDSAWDDTAPYEDIFRGRIFGDLIIRVTAIDNLGHESEPVEMIIKCYSLGIY